MRGYFLMMMLFVLSISKSQVESVEQSVSMGLVPATEINDEGKFILVLTTVPIDLIGDKEFIFLPPGAFRVKKNVFSNKDSFTFQEHNFFMNYDSLKTKKIINAIEILDYSQTGIFTKELSDAVIFDLKNKLSFQSFCD